MISKKLKNKLVFFIIFILLLVESSELILGANISNLNSSSDEKIISSSYIIEFKDDCIISFKTKLKNKFKNFISSFSEKKIDSLFRKNIENYEIKLLNLHKIAKNDIKNIVGEKFSKNNIISKEFSTVFNGMSIKNIPKDCLYKIENLSYVKKIFPNYKIKITLDDSVPLINADKIWEKKDRLGYNLTGKNITIAILDTGVNYNHPDLKDNYIAEGSYDFVNNDTNPMDDLGHGTHCIGIAVGKGNESNYRYVGVAPDAKFYAFKILDNKGEGNFENYTLAMDAAVNLGVDIVSLSFGTLSPGKPTDDLCKRADNVSDAGIVVVTAAGNLGDDYKSNCITSPGCAQKAICVGATDKNDKIAYFSSRGPVEWDGNYMIKPDVVAPGFNIKSTSINGGYQTKDGTSMSTPHVAGAVALILQANLNYSPEDVKNKLKDSALNLGYGSTTQGAGRIDLYRVFNDDILNIEFPKEIVEKQYFKINITNKTKNPVKVWAIFTSRFHLPYLGYGSTIYFKAPTIFSITKNSIEGEIKIFKKLRLIDIIKDNYDVKLKVNIKNNKLI